MKLLTFLLISLCVTVGTLTDGVYGGVVESIVVKSCLEIRYTTPNATAKNGLYAINVGQSQIQPVYCDFESDPPFVWTLVESFDRQKGRYVSKLPGAVSFHKPYYYDYPYNECSPQFKGYRLRKSGMLSIANSPRTTHWRATCNFHNKSYPMKNNEYMRTTMCRYNIMKIYSAQPGCYFMDYVNVRGYTCRNCQLPLFVAPSYHLTFMSSRARDYCQRWVFPGPFHVSPPECNFGHYGGYNTDHECSATKDSTTNYWFGGVYQPETKLIHYSLL